MTRLLFTAGPGAGHVLPLLPLARAAAAAGHEVAFAVVGSTVDIVSGIEAYRIDPGGVAQRAYRDMVRAANVPGLSPGRLRELTGAGWARVAEAVLPSLTARIERLRPDVVVHEPMQVAGLVAAHRTGTPALLHGIGLPASVYRPALERVAPGCTPPSAVLTVCPDSLIRTVRPTDWAMRYEPGTLPGPVPDWLSPGGERPRVCLTFGTQLTAEPPPALRRAIRALGGLGLEVVVSAGGAEADALGPVPPGVRVVRWMPMPEVLATCAAVVHHGGAGTTFTAIAAGVPQVVLPQGADQHRNAAAVATHGLGVALGPDAGVPAIAAAVGQVVGERRYGERARRVAAENAARPGPGEVVARIAGRFPARASLAG
ncbi:glycosyltransferase [Amycolatopsis sp. NEAU-NG30]|uniref:Glycosyltransferase n=1 Tax=Amycolatopsis melonis TaxID=3156488 RepID=A0ABV0L7H9_9PSEU